MEDLQANRRAELLRRLRNVDKRLGLSLERMTLNFAANYIELGVRSSNSVRELETICYFSNSSELRYLAGEALPMLMATRVSDY